MSKQNTTPAINVRLHSSKQEPKLANIDAAPSQDNGAASHPASSTIRDEIGGPKGLEPTRYGDWEKGGRCIDF